MTTREDIAAWFDRGVAQGAKYLLVICDTFDHDDYPSYAASDAECLAKYKAPGEMQRVMEVYNLTQPAEPQLNERRCLRLPAGEALTGAQPAAPAAPSAAEFVLSDVDPVVLAAWKLQGRKVGAMLRESSAAVEELTEELENAKDAAPAAPPADSAIEVPDIGMVCPTAPERIWLQVDPEPEDEGMPVYPTNPSVDDVTWCWDKINETDTLYIRADLVRALVAKETPHAALEQLEDRNG